MRRPLLVLLPVLGLLATGATMPVQAGSARPAPSHPLPRVLALPDGFQPEGIAIGRRPVAYLGSRATGDVLRLDLRSGASRVLSQGPGTPSLGLKVGRHHRLFVAGGTGGDARVVSTRTGRVMRSYSFASSDTFVNDVVLTRRTAWFTDSSRPRLYGVRLDRHGVPRGPGFTTLRLRGDWEQVGADVNANGIVTTPDHRALLVVNSTSGELFRVDRRTGVARVVDLHGASLTNGDGLLRRGHTLYAVRNQLNEVAKLRLSDSGRQGRLVDTLSSPRFDVPTTLARFRGSLYLPNARFSTPPTPDTEYTVNRIRR